MGSFPLPSSRLRRTAKGELTYTEIQEDILCFLSVGKAGMSGNRKTTLMYAVQEKYLCLYNWKCSSYVKSTFFTFSLEHRNERALNHVSLNRKVSDEFVVCQFRTKLHLLELLQCCTQDFSTI